MGAHIKSSEDPIKQHESLPLDNASLRLGAVSGNREPETGAAMTAVRPQASNAPVRGQRIRLPDEAGIVVVRGIEPWSNGLDPFAANDLATSEVRMVSLTSDQAGRVRVVTEDGAAPPEVVLAGLWNEWMLGAVRSARSTVLASTMLKPYPHG